MSGRPVELDAVAADWRRALDGAEDALSGAAHGTGHLDAAELHGRRRLLAEERASVAVLLDEVAHDEHVRLRWPLSAPRATRRLLGLPLDARACVFDLDGVLTGSAELHAAAWAESFDELLGRRAHDPPEGFAHLARPFDPVADYRSHLHGRPQLDGVRAFLASRGVGLPEGAPGDAPDAETVHGLANRKSASLLGLLARDGVAAYAGSRLYLDAAHEAGLACAVVSASAHTGEILARSGLASSLDVRVDGGAMRRDRLRPKPSPDTVLAACRLLGTPPEHAVAFETTAAGIAAARAAGVALVVAVDRSGRAPGLRAAGAGVVVGDLSELLDPSLR